MIYFFRRIFLLCLLLCLSHSVWSQFGTTPQIINFPKKEYNASNQNWSIDQDSSGNIFIANNKGLLIYNGAWTLYELPGQQIVRSVACDNKGKIYTGGFGEFGYWEKEYLGNYHYHSLTKKIPSHLFSKEEIWKINKVGDAIYFQSFSTIYVYNKGNITPIPCPGNIMYAFPINGHMYVQVLQKGLYEIKGKTFIPISDYSIFQTDEIITIIEGPQHSLIIGSVHNGLFYFRNGVITPLTTPINAILKTAQVNVGIRLSDSSLAIGTIQKGVYIIDNNGKILEHFDQQNGLQNNTILSLKKDIAQNLWICMDRGVDEVVLQSPFRYFQDVNGEIGSVYAAALYKGDFYIGSNDGLYRYIPDVGFKNVGGINWQVWSLDVLNGQLFCVHNSGVSVIDKDKSQNIPRMPGGWALKILQQNPDFAIRGTYIGLSLFQKGTDGFFHYIKDIKGLETMPISYWIEDRHGDIWLKHAYSGISRIKLNKSFDSAIQITQMGASNGVETDIQQNLVSYKNNICILSNDGIKIWNAQRNVFEKVPELFGWNNPHLYIKKLFTMPNDQYWILKDDNQITYVNAKNKHFPFSLKDFSLVGGYENIISIDSSHSLICGENGFALFSNDLIQSYEAKPPIVNSVFINNKSEFVPISNLAQYRKGNWQINYGNRSIKIVLANAVYDRMVQYRYKLKKNGEPGYWSEWQSNTTKVYTSLSSGDYQLEIQSNVSSGSSFFEFTILSPWYWSWWTQLLYLIIFVYLIVWIYKKNEKRHAILFRQKQLEMEKAMHLQKMQHENDLLLLKKEKLEQEVQLKSEDLANSANELIKRKKLLNKLHIEIGKQKENKESQQAVTPTMRKLSKELERQLKLDKDETKLFEHGFNTVHELFFAKLMNDYPNLTPQDLKLAAYLRMNLGSKEIAPLLNITVRGVELKRYRLRKKLGLEETVNLNEFMIRR